MVSCEYCYFFHACELSTELEHGGDLPCRGRGGNMPTNTSEVCQLTCCILFVEQVICVLMVPNQATSL